MRVADGRLLVAGRDAEALAREHGTPLYAFDVTRVAEHARALQHALARAGLTPACGWPSRRSARPRCSRLRASARRGRPGRSGIDACSPGEVLARARSGLAPAEISFTGTNVSERDLDVIGPAGVHVNLDLLTQLERYGRHCPGGSVGLRRQPARPVSCAAARACTAAAGRPSSASTRRSWTGRWPSPVVTASRSTPSTCTWPTGCSTGELPGLRGGAWQGSGHGRVTHRRRLPDRRGQRGRRAGHAAARGRGAARPRRLRAVLARALRPPRRDHRGRAGRVSDQRGRSAARRGRDRRAPRRRAFAGLDAGWNVANDHYIYRRRARGRRRPRGRCAAAPAPPR